MTIEVSLWSLYTLVAGAFLAGVLTAYLFGRFK